MENNKKKYWGKTITSFVFVLFTMPLGHAMMRIMEDTMSHSAVNTSAVIMGFVGLSVRRFPLPFPSRDLRSQLLPGLAPAFR